MKTIEFLGVTYEIEDKYKFIANDQDGEVWVFTNKPELKNPSHHAVGMYWSALGDVMKLSATNPIPQLKEI